MLPTKSGPQQLVWALQSLSQAAEQAKPVTPHFFLGVGSFCSVPLQILSGSEHVAITPLGAHGEWEQGLGSPGEFQFR